MVRRTHLIAGTGEAPAESSAASEGATVDLLESLQVFPDAFLSVKAALESVQKFAFPPDYSLLREFFFLYPWWDGRLKS